MGRHSVKKHIHNEYTGIKKQVVLWISVEQENLQKNYSLFMIKAKKKKNKTEPQQNKFNTFKSIFIYMPPPITKALHIV